MRIAAGSLVRLKIFGTRVDATEIVLSLIIACETLTCLVLYWNHQGGLPRSSLIDVIVNYCLKMSLFFKQVYLI